MPGCKSGDDAVIRPPARILAEPCDARSANEATARSSATAPASARSSEVLQGRLGRRRSDRLSRTREVSRHEDRAPTRPAATKSLRKNNVPAILVAGNGEEVHAAQSVHCSRNQLIAPEIVGSFERLASRLSIVTLLIGLQNPRLKASCCEVALPYVLSSGRRHERDAPMLTLRRRADPRPLHVPPRFRPRRANSRRPTSENRRTTSRPLRPPRQDARPDRERSSRAARAAPSCRFERSGCSRRGCGRAMTTPRSREVHVADRGPWEAASRGSAASRPCRGMARCHEHGRSCSRIALVETRLSGYPDDVPALVRLVIQLRGRRGQPRCGSR